MAAQTPAEVHESFAKHFTARDLDALMSLYEPGATFVQKTGQSISGHPAVREVLSRSLLHEGQMNLQVKGVFQAGDWHC